MIAFWLTALAMAVAAVAALALPLLRRRVRSADDDEAVLSVYRERDAELAREHERGNIDASELAEAREELERELLQAADDGERRPRASGRGRYPATLATIAVAVPLTAALVYGVTGRPDLVGRGADTGLSPAQIERFRNMGPEQRIRRLEPLVADNPGATRGLVLLAQAYRATGRYGDAVDAYARVRASAAEDDPWLLARQAEALLLANGRRFTASVERLVQRSLELDGDNPLALMLSGHAALARGDNRRAIEQWQRLADDMPADSDNRDMIERLIARARNGTSGAAGADMPDGGSAGDGAAGVGVRVRIADTLADAAPGDTPVFVFARAAGADGGGPPLAVARTTVGELPARIRLSDADAMTSSARLSRSERVRVTARASLSGGASPRAGDLEGSSDPVTIGPDAAVEVTIDRRIGADGNANERASAAGDASGDSDRDGAPGIEVAIRLVPSLAEAAPSDTPVFVFARAAGDGGGGPPLAVARTSVGALPTRIRLTDADAMTSAKRLSQAERVRVTARASLSGGVVPQSGDLEGSSEPVAVAPGTRTEIAIDRRIP